MPSDLQVSNIKDLTGSNTALSIASDGQVSITQNNPTIQLGSYTTFPAGHVVQTVPQTYHTTTVQSSYATVATHIETEINITAGNKVFYNYCIPTRLFASGYAYGQYKYFIYHKVTSGGTYAEMNTGKLQAVYYYDEDGALPVNFYRDVNVCISGVHTPSSGTQQFYRIYVQFIQGNSVTVGHASSSTTTATLMEIQS